MTHETKIARNRTAMLVSSAAVACPDRTVCVLELSDANPSKNYAMAKIFKQFDKADWDCIGAAEKKSAGDKTTEALAMMLCLKTKAVRSEGKSHAH
jgi:hypothetical protein